MKSEKTPKSHLAVYILIKGRKTHKILFEPLKKTSQTLNAARYSELEMSRWLKVANFRNVVAVKMPQKSFLYSSSFNAG